MEFDISIIIQVALATVGMTEVIKNFVNYGGKKFWSLITLIVGVGMGTVEYFLPSNVLLIVTGISAAVIFYDTIFKFFQKKIKNLEVNNEN